MSKRIFLDETLYLEKINLQNPQHDLLLTQLNTENPPEKSYIWDFKKDIQSRSKEYLDNNELIHSPYAIKETQNYIGYLEISDIQSEQYVELVCAIL